MSSSDFVHTNSADADRFLDQYNSRLWCPIAPAAHDQVTASAQHTSEWIIRMGLANPGTPRFEAVERARVPLLAARCYDYALPSQLDLASDWLTFLFLYDDLTDTMGDIKNAEEEKAVHRVEDRLLSIFAGETRSQGEDPLSAAAQDIRDRLAEVVAPGWLMRLASNMNVYIQGVRWERQHERSGKILDAASYRCMRPMISAVDPCFDFAGMFLASTDPDLGNHPLLRQLALMANNHISWVNDLYSFPRELTHDRSSNLVIIVATAHNLSVTQAVERVIERCNSELRAFFQLEAHLETLGVLGSGVYVLALRRWMRGSLDWHDETYRYRS